MVEMKQNNQRDTMTSVKPARGGQIYGFDVLKFFMATMIVAIHTKAFEDIAIIEQFMSPFLSSAVPIFFVLSSYFLFRKMETKGYSWDVYLPFLKRLLILYLFWFVVTLPTTLYSKLYYLDYGFSKLCWVVLKDFLFSYTFPGSWFLTALVVGSLLVFVLKKYLKASSSFLLGLAIIIFLYIHLYQWLPQGFQKPYLFIQTHIRDVVELTPVTGIIWCSFGCVLARRDLIEKLSKKVGLVWCVISFILLYLIRVFLPEEYKYLAIPFLVLSIIILTYSIKLKPSDVYLKLRNLSILIYLIHFQVLYMTIILPHNTLHIVYYLIVLAISLLVAGLILLLENTRLLKILKQSH